MESPINLTLLLVLVTCVASYYAEENPDFKRKWILNPYTVDRYKQYYRLLSSGFIHGGYLHLAFNMLTFYSFGQILENTFKGLFGNSVGAVLYLMLYLVGIVVSDLPSYLRYRHQPHYNSLGASGAVSAVIFATIMFYPMITLELFFVFPMPAFVFAGLYLVYSVYMAQNGDDNINHEAHFFGAVFGIVFAIALYPKVVENFTQQLFGI